MDVQRHESHGGAPRLIGLLALNAALLGGLALVTFSPRATAQSARIRGEYAMVAGAVSGSEPSLVYILDTVNQDLIAVRYRTDEKRIEGIGARNVRGDINDIVGGRFRTGVEGTRGGGTGR
jgi:hypothetical protein